MLIDQINHNLVQGPDGNVTGWLITCTFTDSEMNEIMSEYQSSSSTSSSEMTCRAIVRKMLDAVITYDPDGV